MHRILSVLLLVASSTSASKPKQRPNFVFFFPDTLRAESFGSYGNKLNVTPNVDAFANSGTRFEQAHVMHTQCSPSRATMMTGRYMHVLGHRTQIHLIRAYEDNYWRLLKENGYHVQWYGKNDALSATSFNLSVSGWENDIGYASGQNAFEYGQAGYYSMLSTGGNVPGNDTKNGDYNAVSKAIAWLQSSPPEPFALFLPTRGAHPPYGAPPEFSELFPMDQVKAAVQLRPPNIPGKPDYHSYRNGIPHYRNLTSLPDDVFYTIQRRYLQMISYTDWTFGQLLSGLDSASGGLVHRTAVFFSSDHGDFAGDFHIMEKWPGGADDVLTRVPLVARIPGGVAGHVASGPVQTADIMETMIQMAQINTSWVRFAQSLLPQLLEGASGDTSRHVYSEGGFSFESELFPGGSDHVPDDPKGLYWPRAQEEMSNNGGGSPRWVMVRNLTAKLVYRPKGVSELYDLGTDPRELTNLYGRASQAQLQAELMEGMATWMVQTGDVPPVRNDPRGPPRFPAVLGEQSCERLMEPDPGMPFPYDPIAVNGVLN